MRHQLLLHFRHCSSGRGLENVSGSHGLQARYRPHQQINRLHRGFVTFGVPSFHMHQLRLDCHYTLLKDKAVPDLHPALRRMAKHLITSHCWLKALLREADVQTEYHRAWLRREQPREGAGKVQLVFLAEQMEE